MGKDSEKGRYESPEGSHTWEYLSTFCCTIVMLCIGNVAGWNSPTLGKLFAPDSAIPLTPSEASTMAALVSLGHMIGPPLTMLMVDKLGRKASLIIASAPLVIGWGLVVVAKHVMVLFVARFICGIAVGLACCICPIYLGEVASPQLRGGMGMLISIMFNSGVLFMMLVVPYVTVRVSASICMGIAIAFVASFWFMPESPYFLALVGRTEEAESSLEKLRGKTDISEEMELIKLTLLQRAKPLDGCEEKKEPVVPEKTNAFTQLYMVPGNRKALFIMFLFTLSHNFGGFITVMIYGHVVFTSIDIGIESHICTTIVAILQFISTILASFLVDRIGRKPLVCVSGVISSICLVIIGAYFLLIEYLDTDVKSYAMLPFCSVFVLVVAANCGLMPIQNVVLSEIFDTDIKALASCTFGIISGLTNGFAVKTYLLMATTWGLGQSVPFLSFAIITSCCTASLMWLLPETKGKTFLQIQKDLNA